MIYVRILFCKTQFVSKSQRALRLFILQMITLCLIPFKSDMDACSYGDQRNQINQDRERCEAERRIPSTRSNLVISAKIFAKFLSFTANCHRERSTPFASRFLQLCFLWQKYPDDPVSPCVFPIVCLLCEPSSLFSLHLTLFPH